MREIILAGLLLAFGLVAPLVLERYMTGCPEWIWRIITISCVGIGFILLWFFDPIYAKVWGDRFSPISSTVFIFLGFGTLAASFWWGIIIPRHKASSPIVSIEPQTLTPSPVEDSQVSLPTIHDYFAKDFPDQVSFGYVEKMLDLTTQMPSYDVEVRLCYDFAARAEILLLYFPSSPRAMSACSNLAPHVRDIIKKITSTGTFKQKMPTDIAAESSKDLIFTGKVYIYTEDDFSVQEIGELDAVYKANDLLAVFRSNTYSTLRDYQDRAAKQSSLTPDKSVFPPSPTSKEYPGTKTYSHDY